MGRCGQFEGSGSTELPDLILLATFCLDTEYVQGFGFLQMEDLSAHPRRAHSRGPE